MRKNGFGKIKWFFRRPFWKIKNARRDYELRHLKLGKIKQRKKGSYTDFEVTNISWDVSWLTHLYLAVIIRDYLRHFIKNSPVIGNTVFEGDYSKMCSMSLEENEYYSKKWHDLVNSVADEFDELVKLINGENDNADESYSVYAEKERMLANKAFADLAQIYDELWW